MTAVQHPAKFTDVLLEAIEPMLDDAGLGPDARVLDPFAGTGKIHLLHFDTVGVELEPEWAALHPSTLCGDATALPFEAESFDAIVTSPTYGNRMADHHDAKDASRRNTYTHVLGRKLHANNTGAMQWGDDYRAMHVLAWMEARRVLKPGGLFVLNCKNFYRRGELVDVVGWHIDTLIGAGFAWLSERHIECPGQRHGANGHLRVPYEHVVLLRKVA